MVSKGSKGNMGKRWRFALAATTLAGILLACGSGFLDGISGGSADGGSSGSPEAAAEAGPTCDSARWPERPLAQDGPRSLSLTFAADLLRIDTISTPDAGGPPPRGFDLDKKCTCPESDSCLRPSGTKPACDGTRGQDNVLSQLFNQLNAGLPIFPATFATDRIHSGFFTVLFDVRGWNGEPDDPSVFVALRLSQQIDKKAEDGGRKLPLFDGNDLWTVDPESIAGGYEALGKDCRDNVAALECLSKVGDSNAYVAGGKLVAFPRADAEGVKPVSLIIRSAAGAISYDFVDFSIIANITGPKGGPYRLDGELGGRLQSDSFLTSLAALQDVTKPNGNEPPLCANPGFLNVLKTSVCAGRDLAAPGRDNTGDKCSFLSSAFSFGAGQAVAGTILAKDGGPNPCGDASFTCD